MLIEKENIDTYRFLSLIQALKMEMHGLKGRGRSAYSILKDELNIKGSRQKVLDQVLEIKSELMKWIS